MPTTRNELSEALTEILGLHRHPVAVKFYAELPKQLTGQGFDPSRESRYCQALMRASEGERVLIAADTIACPASAAAFGFKPLPEILATGRMLHNMGLFATPEAGRRAKAVFRAFSGRVGGAEPTARTAPGPEEPDPEEPVPDPTGPASA